jgi:hypothetical protein
MNRTNNRRAAASGGCPVCMAMHPKWRKAALVLGCLAPWVLLAALALRHSGPRGAAWPGEPAIGQELTGLVQEGPWGDLRLHELYLNGPEPVSLPAGRTNQPEWFFGQISKEGLGSFLMGAGCREEEVAELLRTAQQRSNGCVLNPSLDARLALSKTARARIYSQLGTFEENTDQYYAVRWSTAEYAKWLASAALEGQTKAWIEKLTYSDGAHVWFGSEPELLCLARSGREKLRVREALLRTKALVVALRIEPGSDVEGLVRYWGTGGREREVRPILEGVARLPEGGEVDIVNLLPPMAQALLYTYPPVNGPHMDCHWTAYNFFNPSPKQVPVTGGEGEELLTKAYVGLPGSAVLRLGDLVGFADAGGMVHHTAVYIAGDVLFTKNGASADRPWVLMRLAEVQDLFWHQTNILYARKKG